MNRLVDSRAGTYLYAYFLLAVVIIGLFSSKMAMGEESCTQLLTTRCEICHYLTRVCRKVDAELSKKYWFGGPEGTWERTVKNMVSQGAVLTDAEEKMLVACLSKPGPEVLNICEFKK